MKIIELDEVDSTNEFCKRAGNFDMLVTAVRQTAGKGTKGRSFVSDEGGLYVSIMRRFEKFNTAEAFTIMVNACVAVCKTMEHFGLKPVIRWANDVLIGGKKICGTLIENSFSGSNISRSIIGMGININNVLPEELSKIATTMSAELGKSLSVKEVRAELIKNLRREYNIQEYKNYIDWFGREITLKTSDGEFTAIAADVDLDGGLLCVVAGTVKKISAAEVSLRL